VIIGGNVTVEGVVWYVEANKNILEFENLFFKLNSIILVVGRISQNFPE